MDHVQLLRQLVTGARTIFDWVFLRIFYSSLYPIVILGSVTIRRNATSWLQSRSGRTLATRAVSDTGFVLQRPVIPAVSVSGSAVIKISKRVELERVWIWSILKVPW